MINQARSSRAADLRLAAQRDFKQAQSGDLEGSKSRPVSAEAASDRMSWAQDKIESFKAIESGQASKYRDRDESLNSVQTNFYHNWQDVKYTENKENGSFSFSEVTMGESRYGVPYSETTIANYESGTLTVFSRGMDAWGEGSVTLGTSNASGGQIQSKHFG